MITLYLLLLTSWIGGALSDCPNPEFIRPHCSCKTVLFGTHTVCSNINSTEALIDVLNILKNYDVNTILFRGLRLASPMPSDLFQGVAVSNLHLVDSVLTFENRPLQGLETTLTQLDLMNCNVGGDGLASLDLRHMRRLTELNVQFVHLGAVSGSWLHHGPEKMANLRLDHDEIDSIQDGAFGGLKELRKLSLADNKLKTVGRAILPRPASSLNWLDLSYNRLDSLPQDFFSEMPRLKRVVLSGNKFNSLPQNTWQAVWTRLEHLLLKDNPMVCDHQIKWLLTQKTPNHFEGTCQSPEELSGTELSGLTAEQLT